MSSRRPGEGCEDHLMQTELTRHPFPRSLSGLATSVQIPVSVPRLLRRSSSSIRILPPSNSNHVGMMFNSNNDNEEVTSYQDASIVCSRCDTSLPLHKKERRRIDRESLQSS